MRNWMFRFGICFLIGTFLVSVWSGGQKLLLYKEKAYQLEQTVDNISQQLQITQLRMRDSITIYQAEVKNLTLTRKNLERANGELLRDLELKSRDLQNITSTTSVIRAVDTVVAEVDTFGGLRTRLVDPYVRIDVTVTPQRLAIIDYQITDSITVISFQKQHRWLFGLIKWKEHVATRVVNHNPNARVTELYSVDVID